MNTETLSEGVVTIKPNGQQDSPVAEPNRLEYRVTRLDTTQLSAHWPAIAAAIQASTPDGFDKQQFTGPNVFQAMVSGQAQAWAVEAMRDTPQIVMWVLTRWQKDAMTARPFLTCDGLHSYEAIPDHGMEWTFATILKFCRGGGGEYMTAVSSNPRLIGLAKQFGADTSCKFITWRVDE